MKTPLKTLACAIAAAFALFACEDTGTNSTGHNTPNNIGPDSKNKGSLPVMSDKVVSYQIVHWNEALGFEGIITDTETLKLWFPNDYDEQKEDCNYFAIYNSTNSTSSGYLVLTKGMTLYSLHSSSGEGCVETKDIFYEAMLVCDDNANTIKNNFKRESYAVPDWDCTKWETTPEKGFFSKQPRQTPITEIPVMSDKVVSYQTARYIDGFGFAGIVTDTDTLRSWFPNDYNDQRKECNYFAAYNSTNSTSSGYLVLTQDMVLYSLHSSSGEGCVETCDIFYEAMLVCDDKAGTIKNKFKRESYAVPGWDCTKWETAPEKGFFPRHEGIFY
jgi:hypothetical protein